MGHTQSSHRINRRRLTCPLSSSASQMIYAVAGSIMGVGEIVLLPLDVLKIKAQTNPESLKGRGVVAIFAEEGMALYKCVYSAHAHGSRYCGR